MYKNIIGIDLSDMGTIISIYSDERKWSYPTVICKDKNSREWHIGESAYEKLLSGEGSITDKLLTLLSNGGTATLYGIKYSALQLMTAFLQSVLREILGVKNISDQNALSISIPETDKNIVSKLYDAAIHMGFKRSAVKIVSRPEAFIYYMMSQTADLHNNNVGMFCLEDNSLYYYEMKAERKAKSTVILSEKLPLDEGFDLSILKSESGMKLADKILLSCAQRLLKGKLYSAIVLCGKGFNDHSWAPNFMHFICSRRKVFVDDELFSRGAGIRGADAFSEQSAFRFTPICEGRVECSVFIDVSRKDISYTYPIIQAGESWYDFTNEIKLIPFDTKTIELNIVPMNRHQRKTERISLDFLPARERKTTVISLKTEFIDEKTIKVKIRDCGFGEIIPPENVSYEGTVKLWD